MDKDKSGREEANNRVNQAQIFELITGKEVSWQAIIYDLIETEQLDPWDIDIGILAEKYLETIKELEETNFFISSKVLLACSLLLRLKSEILMNYYLQSLDEILYGKKEEKKYELERIEIDSDELPVLGLRTPIPRYRKVTLNELMASLVNAIETENRRIRKDLKKKQAEKSALVVLPKPNQIPLRRRITDFYLKIQNFLKPSQKTKMLFSELALNKEEKLSAFLPVLHLSHEEKLWLKQDKEFEDFWMMIEKSEEESLGLEKLEANEES